MTTVLVIGASRGIGLEFARQYAAAGARVIATARDTAGLERLRALGAQALRLDLAQPASVSGLAWQLDGEKIDIALYVAGVYAHGDAKAPPTQEQFDRTLHANVLGAMQVIPQVAPLVEAAAGRFAFMGSGMGQIGAVSSSHGWTYRVSKAALNMAVATAQLDYPGAILVALCPGWVRTELGGPDAPLSVEQSVNAMRATIAALTPAHKGQFLRHDGSPYPSW
ncbi:SDR family oxidoreductase [Ramlibacter sp. 2FC]|uniref:SDR family oxidoreductase n=1 Tax=Ramlibacter sp. 2FC TaxID=2502188 RepID=UPI0010F8C5F2|nr:SDR family oxidoreductase [Ramlibacter sp. 2FC]